MSFVSLSIWGDLKCYLYHKLQTFVYHIQIFSQVCNWKFQQLSRSRLHPLNFSSGYLKITTYTTCIMHYSSHVSNHNNPCYFFLFLSLQHAPSPTCQVHSTVSYFNCPGLRKCHVVLESKNRRCSSVNIFIVC